MLSWDHSVCFLFWSKSFDVSLCINHLERPYFSMGRKRMFLWWLLIPPKETPGTHVCVLCLICFCNRKFRAWIVEDFEICSTLRKALLNNCFAFIVGNLWLDSVFWSHPSAEPLLWGDLAMPRTDSVTGEHEQVWEKIWLHWPACLVLIFSSPSQQILSSWE